jgi:hypothetical protein
LGVGLGSSVSSKVPVCGSHLNLGGMTVDAVSLRMDD